MITRVRPGGWSENFEQDIAQTTGATFYYTGGPVNKSGTITDIPDGSVTLSNGQNIVYIDYSGTPTVAATLSSSKPTQADSLFLFIIQVSGGQITDILDLRSWSSTRIDS